LDFGKRIAIETAMRRTEMIGPVEPTAEERIEVSQPTDQIPEPPPPQTSREEEDPSSTQRVFGRGFTMYRMPRN